MSTDCPHTETATVVTAIDDEHIADVCLACHDRLPVDYGCGDCEWVEVSTLGRVHPWLMRARACERHGGRPARREDDQ